MLFRFLFGFDRAEVLDIIRQAERVLQTQRIASTGAYPIFTSKNSTVPVWDSAYDDVLGDLRRLAKSLED